MRVKKRKRISITNHKKAADIATMASYGLESVEPPLPQNDDKTVQENFIKFLKKEEERCNSNPYMERAPDGREYVGEGN